MKRYSLAMAAGILLTTLAFPACDRSDPPYDPALDGVTPRTPRDTSYLLENQKKLYADQGPKASTAPAATTPAVEPTAAPVEGEAPAAPATPATPAAPVPAPEAPPADNAGNAPPAPPS
jgi:hypothetical protein